MSKKNHPQLPTILLTTGLILAWLSHLVQVFVPETGFDALWYHLPVVRAIVAARSLIYLPDLYQSLNPLAADLFFALGYFLANDLGTKIVAYLFGLSLIFITYKIARLYLSRHWSLLLILLVSTFQVVAWQSASFYVDVAKASFELVALYFLLKFADKNSPTNLAATAIFWGLSLGTKLFNLLLLPFFILLVAFTSQTRRLSHSLTFLLLSLLPPLPFYLFSFFKTGQPFYSFGIHLEKLAEIGGNSSPLALIVERTLTLPTSIFSLTFAPDYTTIIFLIFLPTLFFLRKHLSQKSFQILLAFSLIQYLLWWYLPPPSTRYALSGFITLAIIYFINFKTLVAYHRHYLNPILLSIFLAILINFLPRLFVNYRSLRYLTGQQTKARYLEQFYDGSIDRNIKEWHFRTTP